MDLNISLPQIDGNGLDDKAERRKILEYLYQLNDQLRFVLNNLDETNFSDEFSEQITGNASMTALTQRVEDTAEGVASVRRQTAEGFSQMVKKDGVLSAINQSSEIIQILAQKIALEGYVTINGTFSIDEDGYVRCTGGTLGDFAVNADGGLFGKQLTVGSMTLAGNKISGFKLTKDNLDSYDVLSGASAAYLLCMTDAGKIFAANIDVRCINATATETSGTVSNRYQFYLSNPNQAPTLNYAVLRIMPEGQDVNMRASYSASSQSYGICNTGEMYAWYNGSSLSVPTVTDGNGLIWANCNCKLTYSAALGKYIPDSITPCYICQTNSSKSKTYWATDAYVSI